MAYGLVFSPVADRQMDAIPARLLDLVRDALEGLKSEPRPPGSISLRGRFRRLRRLRVGDYRAIYQVDDDRSVIRIVLVGHRKHVYDQLERMRS